MDNLHYIRNSFFVVHDVRDGTQDQCIAALSLVNSPVRSLQFVTSGARLAIGFECGQVSIAHIMFNVKKCYYMECNVDEIIVYILF